MNQIYDNSLKGILQRIGKVRNVRIPEYFKNDVLSAIQLYFDGIVESMDYLNQKVMEEEHEILEAMIKGVKLTVSGYYCEREIPIDKVQNIIMPLESKILKYGSKRIAKSRHLFGNEYQINEYAMDVEKKLCSEGIDLIIPIASGGFEPAALVAHLLKIDNILPVRYSRLGRRDQYVRMTETIFKIKDELIKDKKILIVEDIVSGGLTLNTVVLWTSSHGPSEVYASAVNLGTLNFPAKNLSPYIFKFIPPDAKSL